MRFISDYEHLLVIVTVIVLFCLGLERKINNPTINPQRWILGKDFSNVLKGVGCILVMIGHFGKHMHGVHESGLWLGNLVYMTAPNIGLVWFMFISGYGLTVSYNKNREQNIVDQAKNRLEKIFKPLLLVTITSIFVYIAFPIDNQLIERYTPLPIVDWVNNYQASNIPDILLYLFGWGDWYIVCIVAFYIIFYFVSFVNNRLTSQNQSSSFSIILTLFLVCYYILAFVFIGKHYAHYYRLTWAFLFGHLLANYVNLSKPRLICMVAVGLFTWLFEYKFMIVSFLTSLLCVYVCLCLNRKYAVGRGAFFVMGTVSYFVYLLHERLGWFLLIRIDFFDLILWIFVTFILSILFSSIYKRISIL